ncbi:MAG: hypothetical protein QOF71_238 [Candidatus Eremiobacteraeota bacterium]|jgi:hypothetical protein|nr:hypothetical protein [Candidatus Eremiobacteraeota bacterium]
MRNLLARLAVLGAFAVATAACSNGSGGALPFGGPPNAAGGSQGQFQSSANGTALLRFVQGSPDRGTVDVCVDNLPFGVTSPSVAYGSASGLFAISGGISHTVAVYPTLGGANVGLECPTAPGPYLGLSPILVTTITPAANQRQTIVLGGTNPVGGPNTLGLFIFTEPSFAIAPAGNEVISHNAAPVFSTGKANGVGFGQCTTTVTPCTVPVNLTGAQGLAAPKKSSATAPTVNGVVVSGINAVPAGFYDGIGVPAGTVVPITSIAAPNQLAGQPYVIELYAIDAPAGGLNLVPVVEQTLGFGF